MTHGENGQYPPDSTAGARWLAWLKPEQHRHCHHTLYSSHTLAVRPSVVPREGLRIPSQNTRHQNCDENPIREGTMLLGRDRRARVSCCLAVGRPVVGAQGPAAAGDWPARQQRVPTACLSRKAPLLRAPWCRACLPAAAHVARAATAFFFVFVFHLLHPVTLSTGSDFHWSGPIAARQPHHAACSVPGPIRGNPSADKRHRPTRAGGPTQGLGRAGSMVEGPGTRVLPSSSASSTVLLGLWEPLAAAASPGIDGGGGATRKV
ncbi:hypothetical protein VTN96DRAFT_9458 [Rasamsonia emersonii]